MARRTIQARRASPYLLYLLIAFVVLAVAGWVLWAWTYSTKNELELYTLGPVRLKQAADTGRDAMRDFLEKYKDEGTNVADVVDARLKRAAEIGRDAMRDFLEKHKNEGTNVADVVDAKTKLSDQYREEIQRLTLTLVGDSFKSQQGQVLRQSVSDVLAMINKVMTEADTDLKASYVAVKDQGTEVQMTSMLVAVKALQQRLSDLVTRVGQAETAKKNVDGELAAAKEQLNAVQQEQQRQTAQKDADYAKEKRELDEARASAVKAADQVKAEMQRLQDRLIQERRLAKTEKDALDQKINTQVNAINELRKRLEEFVKLPSEMAADGHVISIAEQGRVAYCDLGKDDGILMGMTFSIMSPSEVGKEEAKPKGAARIVKILAHSAEMRVFQSPGQEPVVVNDLLFNPIYDRQRRLHFVLVGKMDVSGDGTDQTEALKAMIQKFGGKTDNQLSLQTDYLVVGEQPELMPAPAADASPEERQAYENSRKAFLDYSEAKAKADASSIPIMNLNRFLALTGMAGSGG